MSRKTQKQVNTHAGVVAQLGALTRRCRLAWVPEKGVGVARSISPGWYEVAWENGTSEHALYELEFVDAEAKP